MIVIGAPFGNYLTFAGCDHTLGTYTLERRRGRWWRALLSLRYNWRQRSWINKLGLRNPGIDQCPDPLGRLISIAGFSRDDWVKLVCHSRLQYNFRPLHDYSPGRPRLEFNLSCPNIRHLIAFEEVAPAIDMALEQGSQVTCKLPPVLWMNWVHPLWELGVRRFHLCNTIPTPGGGISGAPLKQFSIWAVSEVRQTYPSAHIVGGGGVYTTADVLDYLDAGANDVAVGSMLLNPFNWLRIPELVLAGGSKCSR